MGTVPLLHPTSRRRPGVPGAALVLAGLILAPAVPLAAQQTRADTAVSDPVRVLGTVVDRESGEPVEAVRIRLTHRRTGRGVGPVVSDSLGLFRFEVLEAGPYTVRATRLGYRALTDTVRFPRHAETRIRLSVVPEALDLEPLVVTAVQREPYFMRELEERRAMGLGSFVTREEIEARHPHKVSDLLRMMPGIRVVPGRQFQEAGLVMRGQCRPRLWVDGMPVMGGLALDQILRPDDVEAIEVYSAANIPPRFNRNTCGVVVVWTRVPRRPEEPGGSFWRRAAIVGGLVLVGLVLNW